jgi:hypothetical protein
MDATCFMQSLGDKLGQPAGIRELIVELAASDYVRKGRAP